MPDDPHPKTSILLERWHDGDSDALAALVETHRVWLYDRVRQCMTAPVRARLETGDLVQEVLLEFLESAPRFTIENGKLFRGLLFKIIENTQREQYRWWSARRRDIARERPLPPKTVLQLDGGAADPAEQAGQNEREAWIRLGLEFLDEEDLRVIVLRDYDRRSFVDIAGELGKTKDAARMQHGRAVERLAGVVGMLRRGEIAQLIDDARTSA